VRDDTQVADAALTLRDKTMRSKRPFGVMRRVLRRRRERGQSLVELSLLLPFFLVIVVGVAEVADGMNAYITLVDASRDAARMGSKNVATDAQMKALAVTEGARLRNPVQTSGVTVTHLNVNSVPAVRVRVCTNRTLLMNVPLIMPDNFSMCATTTMRKLPVSS
jgi:Flp pilus assembly protein TadG